MAVNVTSNMTLIDGAESTGGWTGVNATYSGFQRQGSTCLGAQASNGSAHLYFTGSALNLSNSTVFVWLKSGNPTNQATGGYRIVLGDGTNTIAYYVGGFDNDGFTALGWNGFKVNLANRPNNFEVIAGSEANLNTASITQVGGGFNYGSKAVGNTDNVFIDALRYVNNNVPALVISGGTTGDRGTFQQVADLDLSTANAWGVVKNIIGGSKVYQVNFGIRFGNSGTGSSYFQDNDAQIVFTGNLMQAGAMDMSVVGNATGTNLFSVNNNIFIGVGTPSNINISDTNVNTLQITNSQFSGFGNITAPTVASVNRFIRGTIFNTCGLITVNALEFTGCAFTNSIGDSITVSNSSTFNVTQSEFSTPTNSAVEITVADTYEFNGLTFEGTDGVSNYDVENTTAGAVTINASGGSNPSFINNSGSGTTTINNNVNVTLTGLQPNTEVRVYNADTITEIAGEEDITDGNFSFSTGAGQLVDIRIFAIPYEPVNFTDFEVPTADTTLPVEQRFDRNYDNP